MEGGGEDGCGLGIVRRASCLVVGPVVFGSSASLFGCAAVVWAADPMTQ